MKKSKTGIITLILNCVIMVSNYLISLFSSGNDEVAKVVVGNIINIV